VLPAQAADYSLGWKRLGQHGQWNIAVVTLFIAAVISTSVLADTEVSRLIPEIFETMKRLCLAGSHSIDITANDSGKNASGTTTAVSEEVIGTEIFEEFVFLITSKTSSIESKPHNYFYREKRR
jgi:hypothetical protein